MADTLKLSLSADKSSKGTISGKGILSFEMDLTDVSFSVDYRKQDRLILNFSASQGLRISTSGTLTLSGSLSHELLNKTLAGAIKVKLDISQSISAALEHSFDQKSKTIKFDLKINL